MNSRSLAHARYRWQESGIACATEAMAPSTFSLEMQSSWRPSIRPAYSSKNPSVSEYRWCRQEEHSLRIDLDADAAIDCSLSKVNRRRSAGARNSTFLSKYSLYCSIRD